MNIIVCAKQVVDVSEIKIDKTTNKPILTGIPVKISDIDKNALESAIKIKEQHGGKITVVTVGPPTVKEKIKELLAMGADEAIIIPPPDNSDYFLVGKLLAAAIQKIKDFDIILCGEASIDLFSGQIAPRIAGELQIPQITYAHKITAEKDKFIGERNLGDEAVTIESTYPVVVSVTKEINEPRLPSLMQILASANKPIHEWNINDLFDTPPKPHIKQIAITGVSMDRKNKIYQDDIDTAIKQLVEDLAKDGVLG
ncbi:MAG: electron transfer flavoprotein subunit beta/FixA family protein [Candidatus Thermoplasmatota archaeon]|nr:electron transfer flavoprotein subunit beta/FixA family protein [Candidatus Thermoplasmatota archaeon]MBU1940204.1 electron transfer flavoprotein subunit beta/FixA family protein [Candidatus Thermoplasmatota archaeon]